MYIYPRSEYQYLKYLLRSALAQLYVYSLRPNYSIFQLGYVKCIRVLISPYAKISPDVFDECLFVNEIESVK